jgi:hypothetical protein
MTRGLALPLLLTTALVAPLALEAQTAGEAPPARPARQTTAAGEARRTLSGADFEKQGVAVGDQVPDLDVVSLDGASTKLSSLWRQKPTLLVTASLTCGRSRESHMWVNEVAKKYGDRLNVAVLYTLEAHPIEDPSPYAKYSPELENPEHPGERPGGNRGEEGFPRRQPINLEQREELAREFRDMLSFEGPIVIDGMDNQGWEALGAGPNMGLLIDRDGKLLVKQGWLDGDEMSRSIDDFLKKPVAR